jgi:diacylglycerol kinase family enzyme
VNRDDVIGALDAFADARERVVDLAEVNGRVFVNNVTLGVYGEAVQRPEYRNAKVRTVLEVVPSALAPDPSRELRWTGPDGDEHARTALLIVSNNEYRLGHGVGDGTRPHLDRGALGVLVVAPPGTEPAVRVWSEPTFRIDADGPVHAGIDGEAAVLDPPLRFRTRPAALRCLIADRHPGASPSAFAPASAWDAIRALVRIALPDRGGMPEALDAQQGRAASSER